MTRSQSVKTLAKNSLLYVGLAIAVVIAVPLLAGVAYGVRLLVPLLIVGGLVVIAVSPKVRRWFVAEADNATQYHGMTIPPVSYYVHPAHSWAKPESMGSATVGVDALAVAALGQVTSIQAPDVGSRIEQGLPLFTLSSGERQIEVRSPVSGVVADINREATAKPSLIANNPYGAGWVVWIEGVNFSGERAGLTSGAAVRAWFRREVDRLTETLGARGPAPTMADGGLLAGDLSARIDDAKWEELTREFFAKPRS